MRNKLVTVMKFFIIVASIFVSTLIEYSKSDSFDSIWNHHRLSKREADAFTLALEEQAITIPLTQFEGDPTLIQQVDRINSITSYNSPDTGDPVFSRTVTDGDKEVIVLTSKEDNLPIFGLGKQKHKYVILRKKEFAAKPTYYVIYAYVRQVAEDTKDAISINGKHYSVEWDTWTDRTSRPQITWTTCSSSVFVPCGSNDSLVDNKYKEITLENGAKQPKSKADGDKVVELWEKKLEISDLFEDLEFNSLDDMKMNNGRALLTETGVVLGDVLNKTDGVVCKVTTRLLGGKCVKKKTPPETKYGQATSSSDKKKPQGGSSKPGHEIIPGVFFPDTRYDLSPIESVLIKGKEGAKIMPVDSKEIIAGLTGTFRSDKEYKSEGQKNSVMVHGSVIPGDGGEDATMQFDDEGETAELKPDDKNVVTIKGFFIPGQNGEPDTFILEDDDDDSALGKPLTGTMISKDKNNKKTMVHGTVISGGSGAPAKFVDDKKGTKTVFKTDKGQGINGHILKNSTAGTNKFIPDIPNPNTKPQPGYLAMKNGTSVHGVLDTNGNFKPYAPGSSGATFTPDDSPMGIHGSFLPGDRKKPSSFTPDVPSSLPKDPVHGKMDMDGGSKAAGGLNGLLEPNLDGNTAKFTTDDEQGIRSTFVPDKNPSNKIHGSLIPGAKASKFLPDNPKDLKNIPDEITPGTMVPDPPQSQISVHGILKQDGSKAALFYSDAASCHGTIIPSDSSLPPVKGIMVDGKPRTFIPDANSPQFPINTPPVKGKWQPTESGKVTKQTSPLSTPEDGTLKVKEKDKNEWIPSDSSSNGVFLTDKNPYNQIPVTVKQSDDPNSPLIITPSDPAQVDKLIPDGTAQPGTFIPNNNSNDQPTIPVGTPTHGKIIPTKDGKELFVSDETGTSGTLAPDKGDPIKGTLVNIQAPQFIPNNPSQSPINVGAPPTPGTWKPDSSPGSKTNGPFPNPLHGIITRNKKQTNFQPDANDVTATTPLAIKETTTLTIANQTPSSILTHEIATTSKSDGGKSKIGGSSDDVGNSNDGGKSKIGGSSDDIENSNDGGNSKIGGSSDDIENSNDGENSKIGGSSDDSGNLKNSQNGTKSVGGTHNANGTHDENGSPAENKSELPFCDVAVAETVDYKKFQAQKTETNSMRKSIKFPNGPVAGVFFKSISNTEIFIPLSGTSVRFMPEKGSPNGLHGTLFPTPYKVGIFNADNKFDFFNIFNGDFSVPGKIVVDSYNSQAILTGIPGFISISSPVNDATFNPQDPATFGQWVARDNNSCYAYTNNGTLVAVDPATFDKVQTTKAATSQKVKGSFYKNTKNQNVFVPLTGVRATFKSGGKSIVGHFTPASKNMASFVIPASDLDKQIKIINGARGQQGEIFLEEVAQADISSGIAGEWIQSAAPDHPNFALSKPAKPGSIVPGRAATTGFTYYCTEHVMTTEQTNMSSSLYGNESLTFQSNTSCIPRPAGRSLMQNEGSEASIAPNPTDELTSPNILQGTVYSDKERLVYIPSGGTEMFFSSDDGKQRLLGIFKPPNEKITTSTFHPESDSRNALLPIEIPFTIHGFIFPDIQNKTNDNFDFHILGTLQSTETDTSLIFTPDAKVKVVTLVSGQKTERLNKITKYISTVTSSTRSDKALIVQSSKSESCTTGIQEIFGAYFRISAQPTIGVIAPYTGQIGYLFLPRVDLKIKGILYPAHESSISQIDLDDIPEQISVKLWTLKNEKCIFIPEGFEIIEMGVEGHVTVDESNARKATFTTSVAGLSTVMIVSDYPKATTAATGRYIASGTINRQNNSPKLHGSYYTSVGGSNVFILDTGSGGTFVSDSGTRVSGYFVPGLTSGANAKFSPNDMADFYVALRGDTTVHGLFINDDNDLSGSSGVRGWLAKGTTPSFTPDTASVSGTFAQKTTPGASGNYENDSPGRNEQMLQDNTGEQPPDGGSNGNDKKSRGTHGASYTTTNGGNLFVPDKGTWGDFTADGIFNKIPGYLYPPRESVPLSIFIAQNLKDLQRLMGSKKVIHGSFLAVSGGSGDDVLGKLSFGGKTSDPSFTPDTKEVLGQFSEVQSNPNNNPDSGVTNYKKLSGNYNEVLPGKKLHRNLDNLDGKSDDQPESNENTKIPPQSGMGRSLGRGGMGGDKEITLGVMYTDDSTNDIQGRGAQAQNTESTQGRRTQAHGAYYKTTAGSSTFIEDSGTPGLVTISGGKQIQGFFTPPASVGLVANFKAKDSAQAMFVLGGRTRVKATFISSEAEKATAAEVGGILGSLELVGGDVSKMSFTPDTQPQIGTFVLTTMPIYDNQNYMYEENQQTSGDSSSQGFYYYNPSYPPGFFLFIGEGGADGYFEATTANVKIVGYFYPPSPGVSVETFVPENIDEVAGAVKNSKGNAVHGIFYKNEDKKSNPNAKGIPGYIVLKNPDSNPIFRPDFQGSRTKSSSGSSLQNRPGVGGRPQQGGQRPPNNYGGQPGNYYNTAPGSPDESQFIPNSGSHGYFHTSDNPPVSVPGTFVPSTGTFIPDNQNDLIKALKGKMQTSGVFYPDKPPGDTSPQNGIPGTLGKTGTMNVQTPQGGAPGQGAPNMVGRPPNNYGGSPGNFYPTAPGSLNKQTFVPNTGTHGYFQSNDKPPVRVPGTFDPSSGTFIPDNPSDLPRATKNRPVTKGVFYLDPNPGDNSPPDGIPGSLGAGGNLAVPSPVPSDSGSQYPQGGQYPEGGGPNDYVQPTNEPGNYYKTSPGSPNKETFIPNTGTHGYFLSDDKPPVRVPGTFDPSIGTFIPDNPSDLPKVTKNRPQTKGVFYLDNAPGDNSPPTGIPGSIGKTGSMATPTPPRPGQSYPNGYPDGGQPNPDGGQPNPDGGQPNQPGNIYKTAPGSPDSEAFIPNDGSHGFFQTPDRPPMRIPGTFSPLTGTFAPDNPKDLPKILKNRPSTKGVFYLDPAPGDNSPPNGIPGTIGQTGNFVPPEAPRPAPNGQEGGSPNGAYRPPNNNGGYRPPKNNGGYRPPNNNGGPPNQPGNYFKTAPGSPEPEIFIPNDGVHGYFQTPDKKPVNVPGTFNPSTGAFTPDNPKDLPKALKNRPEVKGVFYLDNAPGDKSPPTGIPGSIGKTGSMAAPSPPLPGQSYPGGYPDGGQPNLDGGQPNPDGEQPNQPGNIYKTAPGSPDSEAFIPNDGSHGFFQTPDRPPMRIPGTFSPLTGTFAPDNPKDLPKILKNRPSTKGVFYLDPAPGDNSLPNGIPGTIGKTGDFVPPEAPRPAPNGQEGGSPNGGYIPPNNDGGYRPPNNNGGYRPPNNDGGYRPPNNNGGQPNQPGNNFKTAPGSPEPEVFIPNDGVHGYFQTPDKPPVNVPGTFNPSTGAFTPDNPKDLPKALKKRPEVKGVFYLDNAPGDNSPPNGIPGKIGQTGNLVTPDSFRPSTQGSPEGNYPDPNGPVGGGRPSNINGGPSQPDQPGNYYKTAPGSPNKQTFIPTTGTHGYFQTPDKPPVKVPGTFDPSTGTFAPDNPNDLPKATKNRPETKGVFYLDNEPGDNSPPTSVPGSLKKDGTMNVPEAPPAPPGSPPGQSAPYRPGGIQPSPDGGYPNSKQPYPSPNYPAPSYPTPTSPKLRGYFYPDPEGSGTFIDGPGNYGIFTPDNQPSTKIYGTFYPPPDSNEPETFVPDVVDELGQAMGEEPTLHGVFMRDDLDGNPSSPSGILGSIWIETPGTKPQFLVDTPGTPGTLKNTPSGSDQPESPNDDSPTQPGGNKMPLGQLSRPDSNKYPPGSPKGGNRPQTNQPGIPPPYPMSSAPSPFPDDTRKPNQPNGGGTRPSGGRPPPGGYPARPAPSGGGDNGGNPPDDSEPEIEKTHGTYYKTKKGSKIFVPDSGMEGTFVPDSPMAVPPKIQLLPPLIAGSPTTITEDSQPQLTNIVKKTPNLHGIITLFGPDGLPIQGGGIPGKLYIDGENNLVFVPDSPPQTGTNFVQKNPTGPPRPSSNPKGRPPGGASATPGGGTPPKAKPKPPQPISPSTTKKVHGYYYAAPDGTGTFIEDNGNPGEFIIDDPPTSIHGTLRPPDDKSSGEGSFVPDRPEDLSKIPSLKQTKTPLTIYGYFVRDNGPKGQASPTGIPGAISVGPGAKIQPVKFTPDAPGNPGNMLIPDSAAPASKPPAGKPNKALSPINPKQRPGVRPGGTPNRPTNGNYGDSGQDDDMKSSNSKMQQVHGTYFKTDAGAMKFIPDEGTPGALKSDDYPTLKIMGIFTPSPTGGQPVQFKPFNQNQMTILNGVPELRVMFYPSDPGKFEAIPGNANVGPQGLTFFPDEVGQTGTFYVEMPNNYKPKPLPGGNTTPSSLSKPSGNTPEGANADQKAHGTYYKTTAGASTFIDDDGTNGAFKSDGAAGMRIIGYLKPSPKSGAKAEFTPNNMNELVALLKGKTSIHGLFTADGSAVARVTVVGIRGRIMKLGREPVMFIPDIPGQTGTFYIHAVPVPINSGGGPRGRVMTQITNVTENNKIIGPPGSIEGIYYRLGSGSSDEIFLENGVGKKGYFIPKANPTGIKFEGTLVAGNKGTSETFIPENPKELHGVLADDMILAGSFQPEGHAGIGIVGHLKASGSTSYHFFNPEISGQVGFRMSESISPNKALSRGLLGLNSNLQPTKLLESDPKLQEIVATVHSAITSLNKHPGWKTQYQDITPNVTLQYESDIFYGFGNCPYENPSKKQLEQSTTPNDLLTYYMTLLRTNCLTKQKVYLEAIIAKDMLQIVDKMLIMPADAPLLTKKKLTKKESEELSVAFELSLFTQTYSYLAKLGGSETENAASDKTISNTAKFLIEMGLKTLETARTKSHAHSVRLCRNLVTTLTTAFVKLHQDFQRLVKCELCKLDLTINRNDQIQIISLTEFVMRGLGSITVDEQSIRDTYQAFVKANHDEIVAKVDHFIK